MTETVGPPATIMRGMKIRIFPSQRQAETFDLWRRRGIQLHNLLLSLEQAAYSGENVRRELGWRSVWENVVKLRYRNALDIYKNGKRKKDKVAKDGTIIPGDIIKEAGVGREDERSALQIELKELEKDLKKQGRRTSTEFEAKKAALRRIAPRPEPFDFDMLARIRRQAFELRADIDEQTGEMRETRVLRAGLFIWLEEMQAIMARLKNVPNTAWVADLPSHASQKIVNDLVDAINAMLRERKKRASGIGGRDTGFPKFKKQRYAAGSVYFANTQFGAVPTDQKIPSGFDLNKGRIKFPGGVGWVSCRQAWFHQKRSFAKLRGAKLMGGRIWRQGEEWFFSCQWEMPNRACATPTGRTAGVKIDTKLITTYDDRGQTREYRISPRPDLALGFEHKFAGKKLARILRSQKAKQDKLTALKKCRIAELTMRGVAVNYLKTPRPARIKRSAAFFETSAWLADCEARERNRRDDRLHKLTTSIVEKFDTVAIQKMDVAELMKRPSKRRQMRHEQKAASGDQGKRPRDLKPVRKMMRRAAMARGRQLIEYKIKDRRGADGYHEIAPHDVNVSASSVTGTIFPEWKDGRRVVHAREPLPDGSVAVTRLPRNRNAARLSERELRTRKARGKA